jgi:ABC-2 type transport system permease protein
LIRRLFTLVGKDFRIFVADPVAMGLGFIVPAVMILVFGLVFGRSGDALSEMTVLAVNEDQGPAGKRLLRALDDLDEIEIVQKAKADSSLLDSVSARQRVERGANSVALIVPRDFSDGLKSGQVRLSMLQDPRDPLASGIVSGLLQRQVFSAFPGLMPISMMNQSAFGADSLIQKSFNGDIRRAIEKNFGFTFPDTLDVGKMFPEQMVLGSDPDSSKKADTSGFSFDKALSGMFKIKNEAVVGQNIVNPGIAQSVAGPAVMFLLFAVGAIAASLLREMRDGTASRLRVTGVSPGEMLFSKYLYAVLLGSTQLAVMMVYGRLIFGLNVMAHPLALLLMIVVTALATSSLGLIIAAFSRTEEQASGLQVTIILAMSAIGGAMIPSFLMPQAIRNLAVITPVHWAMQGFLNIFWRDHGLGGILTECGMLLGMAALLVTVSVVVFYKRLQTELS